MRTRLLALVALVLLTVPALASTTTTVTSKDKGGSTSVHVGDTVHVQLSSTAWTIAGSAGALVPAGAQTTTFVPGPTCRPGGGCGTTDRLFRAVAAGAAQLTASRTDCGEALRCTGDSGSWSVTVRVLAVAQPQKLPFTGAPVGLLALLALLLLGTGTWVIRAGRATPGPPPSAPARATPR